jgi:RHS repeat-associated protein
MPLEASHKTWGKVSAHTEIADNQLRMLGQYHDEETGLHYNRFRYYDPEAGQSVSQDPIGLLSAINNYQYAPNNFAWTDPLGLNYERRLSGTPGIVTGGSSTKLGKNLSEAMGRARSAKWTGYQAQHLIASESRSHPVLRKVGIDLDDASNGIFTYQQSKTRRCC